MNWKNILPKEIKVDQLSLEQCRAFKRLYSMLTESVGGPRGYRIFYRFSMHLLFYATYCRVEGIFPALNRCWTELDKHFLTPEYDNEWLVYFWMLCDFPLEKDGAKTFLDNFQEFMTDKEYGLSAADREHFEQFFQQLRASRLGFYQEILSTAKITKFRELFTGKVISTIRSVPEYDSGEIFVGRIVSYLGDAFLIHNPNNFPPKAKAAVERMIRDKLFYLADSGNDVADYEKFMKLAGPYLMSITNSDEDCPIFDPNEYLRYYAPSSDKHDYPTKGGAVM